MVKELVALNGSEKQVAWAEKIRVYFGQSWDIITANLAPDTVEAVAPLRALAERQAAAAWWIDRKNRFNTGVVGNAVEEMLYAAKKTEKESLVAAAKTAWKALKADAAWKEW